MDTSYFCFFFFFCYYNAAVNFHVQICVDIYFYSLGYVFAGLGGNSVELFVDLPYCFPKCLHHVTFPPAA